MKTFLVIVFLAWNLVAAATAEEPLGTQRGTASWYGSECSKTATGEQYDPLSLTAAHPSLPFGTMVQVTNLLTGCAAVVRINNRGPYCKGRIIDVSEAAARQLKMIQSGTAKVELVILQYVQARSAHNSALKSGHRSRIHTRGFTKVATITPRRSIDV